MSELIARLMVAIETPNDLTQKDIDCLLEDAHIALNEEEKNKLIEEKLKKYNEGYKDGYEQGFKDGKYHGVEQAHRFFSNLK